MAKKCTKKCVTHTGLLFCLLNVFFDFLLLLPLSNLKVRIGS